MKEPPEVVVARHSPLAQPEDVDRGQVDVVASRPVEVLEEPRVVVQGDRAGMKAAERVEEVGHRHLAEPVSHLEGTQLR